MNTLSNTDPADSVFSPLKAVHGSASPDAEIVLETEGLTKRYKNGRGIEDVTLQVQRGDIYGFFGPNGSGKTTAMKIMAQLCRADRGRASLFGYDVTTHFEQAMRKTGVLIETSNAYDYMSGTRNLELALRYYPELRPSRIGEVLEMVGLAQYGREKVAHYSLGMKQRLGMAAALLSKPELLILDEPTNGLDIESTVDMRNLIQHLARRENITFFLSSHLVSEMELLCSRIGIIYEGRLIRETTMDALHGDGVTLEQYFLEGIRHERIVKAVCTV